MGYSKCIVPGCKDTTSRRSRIPHPTFDCYDRFWKWLALIQNPVMFTLDPMYVYKNKRVCIRHFSPDRFIYGTKKLKRSALPDINIGESHKVIKDRYGNVRQDSLCLDLRELSKDHCTFKDTDIIGNVNDPTFEDICELTAFPKEMIMPSGPIERNFRAWPSGGERQGFTPSLSPWPDSSDDPQENIEDCDSDDSTDEAPDLDHEGSADDDVDAPEIASTCDESVSSVHSVKGGTEALREMLKECTNENSLDVFFTKAYQAVRDFPQDLQNQIKKDLLDSIARVVNHEKIQSSTNI